jgi:hypothetical protein
VLLVPEFMVAGSTVKEVIVGLEGLPVGEPEVIAPQPASPTQANRTMARAQK